MGSHWAIRYSDNHLSASLLPPKPLGTAGEGSWTGLDTGCWGEVDARAVALGAPAPLQGIHFTQ